MRRQFKFPKPFYPEEFSLERSPKGGLLLNKTNDSLKSQQNLHWMINPDTY